MADRARPRIDARIAVGLALLAGLAAIVIAMAAGLAPGLLRTIASPAPLVRAALAGGAIFVGGWLLLSAVRRIDGSMTRDTASDGQIVRDDAAGGQISDADLGALVRGVRLVFLAAAAFTAAAGWILSEPLPLVIALVIAGVDIVETSFLLLVASRSDR